MTKKSLGVSFIEIVIVLAIVMMLIALGYFGYMHYINRANDGKRKADLHRLENILEDFYNNEGCYPLPTEICYDAQNDIDSCHICGEEANPLPDFDLPCNPDHPDKKYLYEAQDSNCPQWYRIYTELFVDTDNSICPYGSCGPEGGFHYGISSSNIDLEYYDELYAFEDGNPGNCVICANYGDTQTLDQAVEQCESQYPSGGIYGTEELCCEAHRDADGCVYRGWDGSDCTTCYGTLETCGSQIVTMYVDAPWGTWLEQCCDDHPTAPSCP